MKIALFQPDIAANVGAVLRLGACLGVAVDVIEPCGFPFDMRLIRRVSYASSSCRQRLCHGSGRSITPNRFVAHRIATQRTAAGRLT